ncbi:hypothetical protein ACFV4M_13720 [Kitasatospora indigofera]|uniref:hypothetical protein n=1 Tax=Kitasatospora indigofera TaxID=67307 RepID=UPI0036445827
MPTTTFRRFSLSAILSLFLALAFLASPAHAASPALSVTASSSTVTPGGSVSLSLTFTNVHDTPVQFIYQSVQPTWQTTQAPGLKFTLSGNTVDYTAPVAPGASTTVTISYQVAADSSCGGRIDLYTYLYYEYQAGSLTESTIQDLPGSDVLCV